MQIEIGNTYILDGKTPVRVLKIINRAKTVFSIEMPNRGVDTVTIDRLQMQQDESSVEADLLDFEPEIHSIPDISND